MHSLFAQGLDGVRVPAALPALPQGIFRGGDQAVLHQAHPE